MRLTAYIVLLFLTGVGCARDRTVLRAVSPADFDVSAKIERDLLARSIRESVDAWEHACFFVTALEELPSNYSLVSEWRDKARLDDALDRLNKLTGEPRLFGVHKGSTEKYAGYCKRLPPHELRREIDMGGKTLEPFLRVLLARNFNVMQVRHTRSADGFSYSQKYDEWSLQGPKVPARRPLRSKSDPIDLTIRYESKRVGEDEVVTWSGNKLGRLAAENSFRHALSQCEASECPEARVDHYDVPQYGRTAADFGYLYTYGVHSALIRLHLFSRVLPRDPIPLGSSGRWRPGFVLNTSLDVTLSKEQHRLPTFGVTTGAGFALLKVDRFYDGFHTWIRSRKGAVLGASVGLRDGAKQGGELHGMATLDVFLGARIPGISLGLGSVRYQGAFHPQFMVALKNNTYLATKAAEVAILAGAVVLALKWWLLTLPIRGHPE